MKRFPLILLLLYWGLEIQGQSLKDTIHIDQVVVNAKKRLYEKGVNKTDIDSLVLSKSCDSNLSDLLIHHTSVFIKNYGPGELATASFRGTAASHTQIDWNGINLNSPMLGQIDLSLLPVFFVDDISLYYGSSSLIKNSGALGGLVSINNKPNWNTKLKTSMIQSLGSFQNYQSYVSIGGGNTQFQTNTRLYRESAINNFPFTYDNEQKKQTNANYQKLGFMQEFYSRFNNKHLLEMKIWGMKTDRNLPPIKVSSNAGSYFEQNQKDYSINSVINYKYFTPKGSWQLTSGLSITEMTYDYNLSSMHSIGHTNSFINKICYRIELGNRFDLEMGSDFTLSRVNNNNLNDTLTTGYIKSRNEWSAYGRLSTKISERLSIFFLIRQSVEDHNFIPIIPSLTTEYQIIPNNQLILRANIARNYHLPSLNDLYFVPGGNPGLQPERGYSSDLGLELKRNHQIFSYQSKLSIFASLIDNWIIWKPDSTAFYWNAANLKKVFSRGVEFFINMDGKIDNWSYHIRANYSYTKTTNQDNLSHQNSEDDSYGKQLIYIPFHVYNVLFQVEKKHYHGSISTNYTGNRYFSSNNSNLDIINRSLLNDLEIGKDVIVKKISIDIAFRVNNIFDVPYEVILNRPMPGRNYYLVFKVNYNK